MKYGDVMNGRACPHSTKWPRMAPVVMQVFDQVILSNICSTRGNDLTLQMAPISTMLSNMVEPGHCVCDSILHSPCSVTRMYRPGSRMQSPVISVWMDAGDRPNYVEIIGDPGRLHLRPLTRGLSSRTCKAKYVVIHSGWVYP